MAIEATHLNLFTPQLIQDRDMLIPSNQGLAYSNDPQVRYTGIPYAATLPDNQSFYETVSVQAKTSLNNTDSGLTTYNVPAPRKRSRDPMNQLYDFPTAQKNVTVSLFPSLAGDDIMPQIRNHQFEIESLISQQTQKIRYELEEKQKQYTRLLATSIGEGVTKKLKEKDEQIQRMGKCVLYIDIIVALFTF